MARQRRKQIAHSRMFRPATGGHLCGPTGVIVVGLLLATWIDPSANVAELRADPPAAQSKPPSTNADKAPAPASAAARKSPMLKMSGASYSGPLAPLSEAQVNLTKALTADVQRLAGAIGERNLGHYPQLLEAAKYIEDEFSVAGYQPTRQALEVKGLRCDNIVAELKGSDLAAQLIVVGAHYDSNRGTPGADDNASGVASMLALARSMTKDTPRRSVRFVAFVNEESPYFGTESMGSLIYARRCRAQQENVVAMLSLETLGFYSDADESQKYPLPLALIYPSKGNFIGFIGNVESVELVKQTVTAFRQSVLFPAEGAALPDAIDGVGWSDHWAFWQQGYPALMVTDTAMFRNPHYHQATDKPPTLSYDRLARVVSGLAGAVRSLASAERPADTPR